MNYFVFRTGYTGARQADAAISSPFMSVQFGSEIFAVSETAAWPEIASRTEGIAEGIAPLLSGTCDADLYLVVQKGRLFQRAHPDVRVHYDRGRYLVVDGAQDITKLRQDGVCWHIERLRRSGVVFDERISAGTPKREPQDAIRRIIERLNVDAFKSDLEQLTSYGTRLSTSPEFLRASEWAAAELRDMGYDVEYEPFTIGDSDTRNVVAKKKGQGTSPGLLLLTAHLDSVNHHDGLFAAAPGADDNASGAGGILAIARALQEIPFVNELRFVLFGGEEQGLLGSTYHVSKLRPEYAARLTACVNMDMIGSQNTSQPEVLIEGAPISQEVIAGLAESANTYTTLSLQTSLKPYASDHVPFISMGLPAVMSIESADSSNSYVHSAADTMDRLSIPLALEILRMNAAYIANELSNTDISHKPK